MIYEYAINPEIIASIENLTTQQLYLELFGLGKPRVISRFPKKWKRLVYDAIVTSNDMQRKRIEELLATIAEHMARRSSFIFDTGISWSENALVEHHRIPFHAIQDIDNPNGEPFIISRNEFDHPLLDIKNPPVGRTATDLSNALEPMLRVAKKVLFVDPFFSPEREDFCKSLEAYLQVFQRYHDSFDPLCIEVHTHLDTTGPASFESLCRSLLPDRIPSGMNVAIIRWPHEENGDADWRHKRYILTEFGGVLIPGGLDESSTERTTDIQVLSAQQYNHWWAQYRTGSRDLTRITTVTGVLVAS